MTTPQRAAPRFRFSGHVFMVLVAIVCGVAGAFGAIAFRFLIRLIQEVFFGGPAGVTHLILDGPAQGPRDLLEVLPQVSVSWKLLAPAVGGLLAGPLVWYLAREARGAGIPEVIESVAVRGGTIRPRVAIIKAFASAISIGSGGSLGREGPIVQIGSTLASTIGQLLRVPSRQLRTIVGCGAAAGIAATFNAPIAGALFAVEVILGDFAVLQFSPIVIASVVGTVISRHFLGDFPAFVVPAYELVSPLELIPYMLVGVVAGLISVAFMSVLYATEDGFTRLRVSLALRAAIGGLGVGILGLFFPQVLGVGYATINGALAGELPLLTLGALIFAKLFATSMSVGSGGSGGVFAPSLFMGAVTGGFLGTFLHQWFPELTATSGSYALVTMGALVAATTHAPITAIIMIFELTGNYTIIPALMTACVVSTLVASFLRRDSIYTLKLRRRGIDLSGDQDPNVLRGVLVRDVMDRDPAVVPPSAGFEEVVDLLVGSDHTEVFVTADGRLLGVIYLHELRRVLLERENLRNVVVAGDMISTGLPTVTEQDNLDLAIRIFSDGTVDEIAVLDPTSGRLVGTVHKRDVLEAYNREVLRRDMAGGVSSVVTALGKVNRVGLGEGYVVEELIAPSVFHGKTLAELNLRRIWGVQVLLIRNPLGGDGGSGVRVPTPEDRIEEGDRLVLAGPEASVDALEGTQPGTPGWARGR